MCGGREIFRPGTELSENIFHRNSLAAPLRKPGLATVEAAVVLFGHWFIIGRSRGKGPSDGVKEHELQNTDRRSDLRIRQPFDQLVRVLFL